MKNFIDILADFFVICSRVFFVSFLIHLGDSISYMPSQILIAILCGLGGMLGWGFADFFAKKTIDQIGDVTTLFWNQCIGIFPLLILFLCKPVMPSFSGWQFTYLIILGVWSGLSYIPTYVAFGKGKVSLLSPIFASYAVVVVILSALFLGEVIPFGRVISFVIVFLGILLINGDPRNLLILFKKNTEKKEGDVRGLKEILFAVCLFSVWFITLDQFLSGRYWVPILLGIRVFSTVAIFIYAKAKHKKLAVPDRSLWKYLICIGIFDVTAYALVSLGFSVTPYVSIVAMLSGAFSVPTIILARIFLKEKTTRLQTIGTIVVIVGIIILALV